MALTDSGQVGWLAGGGRLMEALEGVVVSAVEPVTEALAVDPKGWPGRDGGKRSVMGRDAALESLALRCSLDRFGLGVSRVAGVLLMMYSHASGFFDFLHLLHAGCV